MARHARNAVTLCVVSANIYHVSGSLSSVRVGVARPDRIKLGGANRVAKAPRPTNRLLGSGSWLCFELVPLVERFGPIGSIKFMVGGVLELLYQGVGPAKPIGDFFV